MHEVSVWFSPEHYVVSTGSSRCSSVCAKPRFASNQDLIVKKYHLASNSYRHLACPLNFTAASKKTTNETPQGTILAIIALCYSGAISCVSMAISMLCGENDLLPLGHGIVLVVFIGGGLGFVAWVKQYFGNQLVNVACSLASLGCITVLIKEGAVQAGTFSEDRVLQVLLMVVMGVLATTAVNVLVLPIFAHEQVCIVIISNLQRRICGD